MHWILILTVRDISVSSSAKSVLWKALASKDVLEKAILGSDRLRADKHLGALGAWLPEGVGRAHASQRSGTRSLDWIALDMLCHPISRTPFYRKAAKATRRREHRQSDNGEQLVLSRGSRSKLSCSACMLRYPEKKAQPVATPSRASVLAFLCEAQEAMGLLLWPWQVRAQRLCKRISRKRERSGRACG